MRRVLHPVVEWAEETGVAVLGISHASKASAGQAGVHRSLGSVALLAVCRTAWAVVRDDSDPDRRLFLPQKNNLARASGLAFRVEGVEVEGCQTHRLVWESEPVEMTLDDIKPEAHSPKKLEQAIEFLRATLTEPKLATEMYELAQQKGGISAKTLKRARAALGVGDEQRGGRHWWIPTPAMGAAAFRDAIAPSPEADAPPKSEGQKLLRQRANTTPDGQ